MSQKNWIVLLASILGVIVLGGGAWALFNAGKNSATTSSSSSSSVSPSSSSSSKASSSSSSSSSITSSVSSASSVASSSVTSSSVASSSIQSSQASSSSSQATAQRYSDPELPGFSIALVDGWKNIERKNTKSACSVMGGPQTCDNFTYTFTNNSGDTVNISLLKPPEYNFIPAMDECVTIGNTWNRCRPGVSEYTKQTERYFIVDEAKNHKRDGYSVGVMLRNDGKTPPGAVSDMINTKIDIAVVKLTMGPNQDRLVADSFIKTMQF